jgi:hypothetical protein
VNFLLGPISPADYFHSLGRLSDHMQLRGFSFTHTVQADLPALPTHATVLVVCAVVGLVALAAHFQRGRDTERFLFACCIVYVLVGLLLAHGWKIRATVDRGTPAVLVVR